MSIKSCKNLKTKTTVLSKDSFEEFVKLMNSDEPPSEELRKAAQRYNKAIKSGKLIVKD